MVKRKMGDNGRVTIPKELLEKYHIEKDDLLEILDGEGHITIRKFNPEYVCVITGKVTSNGEKIGNSFISYEGLEQIRLFLEKKPKI
jgi:AbrB family transcriptional regulator, transcriptional pleiotropic regulator of transition state genes